MINELKRFKKVAELGNITKASEVLFITQPALTQSIHRLEKELKVKLFKQTGRKIYLTEEGRIVLEISDKIIKLWNTASNVKNSKSMSKISIGLFDSAAIDLSSYIQNKSKHMDIELIIDRSENLLRKLQYGLIDFCVTALPKDFSKYSNAEPIGTYEEKLIPVSSKKWEGKFKSLPFILYDKDSVSQSYIDKIFAKHKVVPQVSTRAVNPLFIKELALKGFGIAILPKNMIKEEIEKKKLVIQKLPISFSRTCGIFKSKEEISDDLNLFINEIIEILKNK